MFVIGVNGGGGNGTSQIQAFKSAAFMWRKSWDETCCCWCLLQPDLSMQQPDPHSWGYSLAEAFRQREMMMEPILAQHHGRST